MHVDILVVGAGPTGLMAANEARRHGLTLRVIDSKAHRSTWSKALVAHARTLEAFESAGLIDAVLDAGMPFRALNITPNQGQAPIRVDLMELEWGDTRYPYWLAIPQYETERCLEEHLAASGVDVDWEVSFEGLVAHDTHVEATLRRADGTLETCTASWLVGCDGGRSPVREAVELGFDRSSLEETFVIADALGDPGLPDDEGATVFGSDGLMFVVPMPVEGRWRIIAHLANHPPGEEVTIDPALIDRLFAQRMGVTFGASDLSWTSQFVLKQGVAQRYRRGRVFIAGDAAHLHSPVGGQGLNTGAQDAHALIWRLALANSHPGNHELLLDSYEAERRPVAESMVKGTSRATRVLTLNNGVLAALRGAVARLALRSERVKDMLGRQVGMLELAYPESPLIIDGPSSSAGPGGRLPDPARGERRLCDLLNPLGHTILILQEGDAGHGFAEALTKRGLHCVRVTKADEGEGLWADVEGALVEALGGAAFAIVRPDRIVAATSKALDGELIETYAREKLGVSVEALG